MKIKLVRLESKIMYTAGWEDDYNEIYVYYSKPNHTLLTKTLKILKYNTLKIKQINNWNQKLYSH